MVKTVEPRSACRRSLGSELVIVETADRSEVADAALKIHCMRLQERFGLPPATASAIAALAYPCPQNRASGHERPSVVAAHCLGLRRTAREQNDRRGLLRREQA